METILVTGGAGYIGSITVRRLLEKGYKVVVLDNLSRGYKDSISPYVTFVEGDIANKGLVKRTIKENNIGAVIHFAGFIQVGESVTHPELYYSNNIVKSITFLETLRACKINKVVFSSSAAVYGLHETMPLSEDVSCDPINPYGVSKLVIEKILDAYRIAHDWNYIALRYFNAAGAAYAVGESHDPETHLIPLVLQVALGVRDNIHIFGTDYLTSDGTCLRDYVHVLDLADAHIAALNALEEGKSGIYNVGTGKGVSVKEIINICREVTRHSIPVVEVERREGDPPKLVASVDKIRRELRWSSAYSIRDIIESAWDWHNKNPEGFKE